MKTGLVLEGGAMRGMYTAGVLDVLYEHGVSFDGIIGVSAGALFGINYLSKQPGRVIRYNKRYNGDPRYMGLRPLLREGCIVSTEYAYGIVPRELDIFDDETYRRSEIPFYAVISEMESGEARYVRITSVFEQMDTLRASGSMPYVSQPVSIDGKRYLDGAVTDSIPFRFFAEKGHEKTVVVLTRERGYRKRRLPRLLSWLMYRRYPAFLARLLNRHLMYNATTEEINVSEERGEIFVFRPSRHMKIRHTEKNPKKLQALYDLGRSDAEILLPKLLQYLKTKKEA